MSGGKSLRKSLLHGWTVKAFYNCRVFEGMIVGETRNMVSVQTIDGIKYLPKKSTTFVLIGKDGAEVKIMGSTFIGRPFERLLEGV